MLKNILQVGTALNKKEQRHITGGSWPRTQEACHQCGGEWDAPLCALPYDSPCA